MTKVRSLWPSRALTAPLLLGSVGKLCCFAGHIGMAGEGEWGQAGSGGHDPVALAERAQLWGLSWAGWGSLFCFLAWEGWSLPC